MHKKKFNTDEDLTKIADWFEGRMSNINLKMIREISNNLEKLGSLSQDDAYKLINMYKYSTDTDKLFDMLKKENQALYKELEEVLKQLARANYVGGEGLYHTLGLKQKVFGDNAQLQKKLKAILETTKNELDNLSNTTMVGLSINGKHHNLSTAYKILVDNAILQATTGVKPPLSGVTEALKMLGKSGGIKVEYASGYKRRLDTALRYNVLGSMHKINQSVQDQIGEEIGADGKEISTHGTCAIDHLDIQGHQFTNEEFKKLQRTLKRPIGKHNCRHFVFSILMGISEPRFNEEQLSEFKKMSTKKYKIGEKTYNRYEVTQLQRQKETQLRDLLERLEVANSTGNKQYINQAKKDYTRVYNDYRNISNIADLPLKPNRIKMK